MTIKVERKRRPTVAFDGTESLNGRALLAVSSLYWSSDWIDGVDVCFVNVTDPNVRIAIEVFSHDTGKAITMSSDSEPALGGADLFAAIAFRSAAHVPLDRLRLFHIPTVLAIQYPAAGWRGRSTSPEGNAAFDPNEFANLVGAAVRALP